MQQLSNNCFPTAHAHAHTLRMQQVEKKYGKCKDMRIKHSDIKAVTEKAKATEKEQAKAKAIILSTHTNLTNSQPMERVGPRTAAKRPDQDSSSALNIGRRDLKTVASRHTTGNSTLSTNRQRTKTARNASIHQTRPTTPSASHRQIYEAWRL